MTTLITVTETVQDVSVAVTTNPITVSNDGSTITVGTTVNNIGVSSINPVGNIVVATEVNAADLGLGNVDNTRDTDKPVSTATQSALNLKANVANPTFTGGAINIDANTNIEWAENSLRTNRLNFQSTNGTSSGIRVVAPIATGGTTAISATTTNDINNTQFINIAGNQSATNPLRIQTGKYTNGTLGGSGTSLAFVDNVTTYATVNPIGPTIATDLTTKSYVDAVKPKAVDVLADGTATTDNLPQGTTNLYYSNSLVQSYLSTNSYAKTSDITTAVNAVIGGAPNALNTLKELADALGDNANFASSVTTSLASKANISSLATVATSGSYTDLTNKPSLFSGSYTDLTNKPTIPVVPTSVSSFTNDANYITTSGARSAISVSGSLAYNSTTGVISYTAPTLATVATTGSYNDLTNKPSLFSGSYTDLSNKPALATVATSGSYTDLSNKPTIPTLPTLATVATSGSYNDLTNKPSIPSVPTTVSSFTNDSGYVTAAGARSAISATGSLSYNSTTGVISYTAPTLATVATTGSYTDLTNKPTIPTVPTTVSSFTNDANYITTAGARSAVSGGTGITYNSSTGVIATNQDISTTASPTFATTTTNLADSKYTLGQGYFTRNTGYTAPGSALTTISGSNGIVIASSNPGSGNGYSPRVNIVYASSDTTAGTNASAAIQYNTSSGTTGSPTAVATNQVLGTINWDGYGTSGWAGTIATTGSGGGTSSIQPLQLQGYAVSAFTDSGGTVTNAPMGFRVRGFAASTNMSAAARTNFIDHQLASATYRSNAFTIQAGTSTTNYASFASSGHTLGQVDAVMLLNRLTAGTPGVANQKNALTIESRRSDQTGVTDTDRTGFGYRVGGTANFYWTNQVQSQYSSSGAHQYTVQVAAGDQTSASPTMLTLSTATPTATSIYAGTTGTGGSTSVKMTIDANKASFTVPVAVPVYTASALRAITGALGWTAAVSDASPSGRLAYWDGTNNRWSYVATDGAV